MLVMTSHFKGASNGATSDVKVIVSISKVTSQTKKLGQGLFSPFMGNCDVTCAMYTGMLF